MNHLTKLTTALTLLASSAFAQQASVAEMIDRSEGYSNLREGVILIETEDQIVFCQLNADDALFDAAAAGENVSGEATCIPAGVFGGNTVSPSEGGQDLYRIIDNSIGYVHFRENVIMIETESGSVMCRIPLSDADFASYASNQTTDALDPAVCVDTKAFN